MNQFAYLAVLAVCLLITAPLEWLGAPVYRRPRRLARAVLPAAAVFLVWDLIAIAGGVWGFNPELTTGVLLPFSLPVEEMLFFLVIPVCGLLTFEAVTATVNRWRNR
ncbi:lycopene cyclase domain-containing protein [Amycolatopsis sp. 195334CR]|uniref:lycopene cyclase domain-containing protein n=1 Tax=Amycolatopsis sp. 195334CR TaxID=2814588 RepID=UPI001A907A16|nr:lycopene cyclase domain-containing protein [Amycolatopsis sp. 195334CR]MBN6040328.1 lycopene cyclase domain-containing protein [Amycolatopsis sp. 195334CR]